MPLPQKLLNWTPSLADYVESNVDGALFFDLDRAGVGVIVQDERGKAIMAGSLAEMHVSQPKSIKTLSILIGLQLVCNKAS